MTANDDHELFHSELKDTLEVSDGDFSAEGDGTGRAPVKHTLNRRQRRSIEQGVQRAIRAHNKLYDVLDAKSAEVGRWTLLEVFAGKARLSTRARQRNACWDVLPPQDILSGGLDLLDAEHIELLKDVIRAQEPDVITLAPPSNPWSAWQRLRKRKAALRELRRQHLPFWNLVAWCWQVQNATGGLVVLEQPATSEALRLPMMTQRQNVHQRVVHMRRMGMKDRISHMPHKKPTAVQLNHEAINTPMFPEMTCDCAPGQHQPIEGSVRLWNPVEGKYQQIKRSTLAAEWPEGFCDWLLNGLEALREESAEVTLEVHQHTPSSRIWEAVPVEVEATPEGQLRQQMNILDGHHRYDYISFLGVSANLTKKIKSTLAHLHVALGHISNEKLARMMSQNGAKTSVLQAIKDLDCQVCKRVTAPTPTPKSAYARPMSWNVRLCSDTFYVWDAKATKYAVTHIIDSFSLYQVAIAVMDATAQTTVGLLRDSWFRAFGPPQILMTDQGPEYQGAVEPLLRTFGVFHDMVPPSASWRMGLAERHGAVLKVMLMKMIKERTIIGLEEMQTAVVAATTARNLQTRVAGYSPMQLIFGKEVSVPGNLMEAIAGQFHFKVSQPQTMDEAHHRAASIRRAATEAYQWLEANEALKKAAGSRARLPRMELLVEGSQVMFYEPPVSRRGLARRLQDNISWVGPAVVVAVERLDGAIKRVWIRYRHKLRGLPLERIRLATGDEIEATKVTKEALQQLADQLKQGRVNAELIPTHEEVEAREGGEQVRDAPPSRASAPDPRYPAMTLSDDEQEPSDDDVGPEELKKATSVLDDLPMSVAAKIRKKGDLEERRSTKRRMSPTELEESSIRATVASSSAVDPAMQTVRQKRDFYETAFRTTQEHLKKMKTKLEKKSALMMEPVVPAAVADRSEACENGESEEATGSEPVYSPYTSEDSNQTMASISSPFIEVDMFEEPWQREGEVTDYSARMPEHEVHVTDMASECQPLDYDHDVHPAGWRADGFRRVGILRNPSSCTRAKVPADRWRLLGDVPSRLRRPLTQAEVLEAYRKGQLNTGQTRPAVARPGLHEDDDREGIASNPRGERE